MVVTKRFTLLLQSKPENILRSPPPCSGPVTSALITDHVERTMKQIPVAEPGDRYERGLYIAPWMGRDGELVLLALTSTRRLAAPPLEIPHGVDRAAMAEALQSTLDAVDPLPIRLVE